MERTFLSHSTRDEEIVSNIEQMLSDYGIQVYVAERDYQLGKRLSDKIILKIENCDYFMLLYSDNGKDSHYVNQEIGYWIKKKGHTQMIPLVQKGLKPDALLEGIEYIEYDPSKLELSIDNVKVYFINEKRKRSKENLKKGLIGLGIFGIVILIVFIIKEIYDSKNHNK